MYGIMSHIQKKRFVAFLCVIQCLFRFQRECFAKECICAVIFLQSRYGSRRILPIGFISEILFSIIAGRRASRMSGYIHFKPHFQRVFSRCVYGSEMSLSAMYGVIAVFFQYLRQCRHLSGALYSRFLAYAVYIPFRIYQHRVRLFVCLVFMQCPTGHPVSCRIHSGKQADAAWRTNTTGIRLRKHHALCRQALHIGRLINVIVMCTLRPKGQRGVLPPHIVYQKHNDIGMFLSFCRLGFTRYATYREYGRR